MKRFLSVISVLLACVSLLTAFSTGAAAKDDNATSGEGSTHPAAEGYAWYNGYQYMYKVTLYAAKSDGAGKNSSLSEDFYKIGTVIMKKSGWSVSPSVLFGSGTKAEYYSGTPMSREESPLILSDASCPKIPIVCGGDIGTVKRYFGSTGTMLTILGAIAQREGKDAYGLLRDLEFSIGGVRGSGREKADLMPDGISNRIPWVIVYEPVMLVHLKDRTSSVAFTATEYAIAALNGWYDWRYSSGRGQAVASLTDRHLPSSVQLEESWFGYPVYPARDDSYGWDYTDVIKGGGWGMRWLPASTAGGKDLSVTVTQYDPSPLVGSATEFRIRWTNGSDVQLSVPCELYSGDYPVISENLTIPANSSLTKRLRLVYNTPSRQVMSARINYGGRFSETDPYNNESTVTVIPRSSEAPLLDYGCYFGGVEIPEPDSRGLVEITWRNYKRDFGTVLCELFLDGELLVSEYRSLEGGEYVTDTYSVFYPGEGKKVLCARINYGNRFEETDPGDNMQERDVEPESAPDGPPDSAGADLRLEPVDPGRTYTEGTEVISSYILYNGGEEDLIPDDGVCVTFEAYALADGERTGLASDVLERAVVPAGESNLIYFRWTVPAGTAGMEVCAVARVNPDESFSDADCGNNSGTISNTVSARPVSDTPDTRYERSAPAGFVMPAPPETSPSLAVWSVWEYVDGNFYRKDYGLCVCAGQAAAVPDTSDPSASYDGTWTVRSGYAFGLTFKDVFSAAPGRYMPDGSSYTGSQTARVLFPEFGYSSSEGSCRTLEKVSGLWTFRENGSDLQGDRVHFTPLWFPDGEYAVCLCADDLWTPAGCVSVRAVFSAFVISGSAYDDWFLGR